MIVCQEFSTVEVVEMSQLVPQYRAAPFARCGSLERDIGHPASTIHGFKASTAGIGFVGRDFPKREVACRCLYERVKLRRVVGMSAGDFHARNDVGFYSRHQVHFNPVMVILFMAAPGIIPTYVIGRSEARRINGKINFYRFQGKAARGDKVLNDWRQVWLVKVLEDGAMMGPWEM